MVNFTVDRDRTELEFEFPGTLLRVTWLCQTVFPSCWDYSVTVR